MSIVEYFINAATISEIFFKYSLSNEFEKRGDWTDIIYASAGLHFLKNMARTINEFNAYRR